MGQSQSEICPPFATSQQVQTELERRFIVSPHPLYSKREEFKLLNEKLTNKNFMLRIITADQSQKKSLESRILKRVAFKNSNLTRLQHYIFEKMESYCAKQFKIYLLFELESALTLREEILMQGKGRSYFSEEAIISGLQNVVNGLLWVRYLKEKHGNINTHHIYCHNKSLVLSDPFLCPEGHEYPEKYPSPQKLKQMCNKIEQYNSYESDLFSIAMCMLEIIPSVRLDAVYKRNYTINERVLREEINKCANYPKLKAIFESLLLNPDNLQNRKRYLQIYSAKSSHLYKELDSSSVSSSKTVKIHKLGSHANALNKNNSMKPQKEGVQKRRNKFLHVNQSINIENCNEAVDKPELETKFLQERQMPNDLKLNRPQENFTYKTPILNKERDHNPNIPNFANKVVFNYSKQTQPYEMKGFNELKVVHSIPTIQTQNYQIPHHFYQFSTSPYVPRPKIQPVTTRMYSRSSSDYSIKSEVVVYEPNKMNLPMDFNSPRDPYYDNSVKESNYSNAPIQKDEKYYQIKKSIDFNENNSYSRRADFQYEEGSLNVLNTLNNDREPVISIGVLENQNGTNLKEQSYVLESKQNQLDHIAVSHSKTNGQQEDESNGNLNDNHTPNLESLPLKLSFLVKDKVSQLSLNQQKEIISGEVKDQDVEINRTLQFKTSQKLLYLPVPMNNRTIPEEEPEQQQSFEDVERVKKGQYRIQLYENGSKYEGFFHNNQREGYGTFYYKDGGFYQGEWKNNLMNGSGKLYYDNDQLAYDGQWYNDEFHGKGKVYNDNWEHLDGFVDYSNFQNHQAFWVQYDGELSHDNKQGIGRWKFSNGEQYQGEFLDDMPHGKGIFYSIKGTIKGIWNNGKLVKKL